MSDRRQLGVHPGSHPGPHPDADQLAAFMEGALSERDREQSLAHLAECAQCREVVFLAQAAIPAPPAKEPRVAPWRRWMTPLTLAAATVACGLVVVLWIHPHPARVPAQTEVAVTRPPAPPVTAPAAQIPPPSGSQTRAAIQRPPHSPSRPIESASGQDLAARAAPAPSQIQGGVIGGLAVSGNQPAEPRSAPTPSIAKREAVPGAPPPNDSPFTAGPVVPSAAPAQPVQSASAASAKAPLLTPPMAAGALAQASPVNGFLSSQQALSIAIEHDRGPQGGFSELSGLVTDASGAVVAGATITLHSSSGAATQIATTSSDGYFALPAVPPGHYDLRVTSPGFAGASRPIDLHARDLALLTSTLHPGAASQTVEVAVTNSALAPTPPMNAALMSEVTPNPSGKLATLATVSAGNRRLEFDAAGTLFISRNGGKRWKKIKPAWPGTVVQLVLASQPAPAPTGAMRNAAKTPPLFQITTSTGAVWISSDGFHWRPR